MPELFALGFFIGNSQHDFSYHRVVFKDIA